jgi:hypothetical protein
MGARMKDKGGMMKEEIAARPNKFGRREGGKLS